MPHRYPIVTYLSESEFSGLKDFQDSRGNIECPFRAPLYPTSVSSVQAISVWQFSVGNCRYLEIFHAAPIAIGAEQNKGWSVKTDTKVVSDRIRPKTF